MQLRCAKTTERIKVPFEIETQSRGTRWGRDPFAARAVRCGLFQITLVISIFAIVIFVFSLCFRYITVGLLFKDSFQPHALFLTNAFAVCEIKITLGLLT